MGLYYTFVVEGLDANQQSWKHTGEFNINSPGEFVFLPQRAIKESFEALTSGRAVYGNPGLGCYGPYEITRLEIKGWKS